jgi:hypothetical protein
MPIIFKNYFDLKEINASIDHVKGGLDKLASHYGI